MAGRLSIRDVVQTLHATSLQYPSKELLPIGGAESLEH